VKEDLGEGKWTATYVAAPVRWLAPGGRLWDVRLPLIGPYTPMGAQRSVFR